MVEHLPCKQGVASSILAAGSTPTRTQRKGKALTKEFTEQDLSENERERILRVQQEERDSWKERAAKREAYLNAPRDNCEVTLKDGFSLSAGLAPPMDLQACTNGSSIAETIEVLKRTANKMRDTAGWTMGDITWTAYAVEHGTFRNLGSVTLRAR